VDTAPTRTVSALSAKVVVLRATVMVWRADRARRRRSNGESPRW
jgi:hypothetical protein